MGLTATEAAGMQVTSVHRLIAQGEIPRPRKRSNRTLDLADVEQASLRRLRDRVHGHHYSVTLAEAADRLDVSGARVQQLIGKDFLPAVRHRGRWWIRRGQLEVVANASAIRWHRTDDSPPWPE